jgi:endonuclease YncB( thermonuclease family)
VTRRSARVSSISPPVKRARRPSAERPPAAADSLHAIRPEEERAVIGTTVVSVAGSPIAAVTATDFWPLSWPTFEISRLVYVIDGDTQVFDYVVDMGFQRVTFQAVVRLLGVNCPEKKGRTAEAGKRATKFSEDWLAGKMLTGGHPLFLRLRPEQKGRLDAFGRLLGVVETYDSERQTLQRALIESGNAIKFMTGERAE